MSKCYQFSHKFRWLFFCFVLMLQHRCTNNTKKGESADAFKPLSFLDTHNHSKRQVSRKQRIFRLIDFHYYFFLIPYVTSKHGGILFGKEINARRSD